MANEKDKFLIVVKSGVVKPQQKTILPGNQPWELEWSTSSNVSMTIDFFNLTVGKYLRSTNEQQQEVKKIEEYWRVTGIPGHARKIRYGQSLADSTSTSAKPMTDGIYVVKITGMSTITEGMHAESGVGIAVVKIVKESVHAEESSAPAAAHIQNLHKTEQDQPVTITNDVLMNLLKLSEEGETGKDD